MDEQTKWKIETEIKSKYWQDIIHYTGFSSNCDLEILEYQFDLAKLLFHFTVRYKKQELQLSFEPHEIGLLNFQSKQFDNILLRSKIVEKIIEFVLREKINSIPKESENTMKNLVIKTTEEDFLLAGVKDDMQITTLDGIIYFGEDAAVNYNNFISYRFIEVE